VYGEESHWSTPVIGEEGPGPVTTIAGEGGPSGPAGENSGGSFGNF